MRNILILVFLTTFFVAKGQVEDLSRQKNIFFQDEITFGVQLHNNGWSTDIRRGYYVNNKLKNFYEFGFTYLKHPKEYKRRSYYSATKKYTFGKINQVYNLNFGYGKQITLFDKREIGTVDIRLIISAGTNIAILKPIYYEIIVDVVKYTTALEKFKPSHQPGLIIGKAPFAEGLKEIKINPALYFKIGTSFEHSKRINAVSSLEFGIISYFFLNDLKIMGVIDNPQTIISLFVNYRIGKLKKNKVKKNKNKNL